MYGIHRLFRVVLYTMLSNFLCESYIMYIVNHMFKVDDKNDVCDYSSLMMYVNFISEFSRF